MTNEQVKVLVFLSGMNVNNMSEKISSNEKLIEDLYKQINRLREETEELKSQESCWRRLSKCVSVEETERVVDYLDQWYEDGTPEAQVSKEVENILSIIK